MMAFRLVEHSNKIGKVFFHHIEDVEKKKFFIQKLSTLLEGFSSIITMEMSNAYKGDGVRIFHSGLLKLDREEAFNQKTSR